MTFDKTNEKINNYFVNQIFSKYGEILKILIFKRKFWMAFIQFDTLESAVTAKTELDKAVRRRISMRIKFSNR